MNNPIQQLLSEVRMLSFYNSYERTGHATAKIRTGAAPSAGITVKQKP